MCVRYSLISKELVVNFWKLVSNYFKCCMEDSNDSTTKSFRSSKSVAAKKSWIEERIMWRESTHDFLSNICRFHCYLSLLRPNYVNMRKPSRAHFGKLIWLWGLGSVLFFVIVQFEGNNYCKKKKTTVLLSKWVGLSGRPISPIYLHVPGFKNSEPSLIDQVFSWADMGRPTGFWASS
ncbi:unnamed protein product [Trifolium pratense]|uniref:Uncharacterized protein n=1 Tax=Trifolium pratense TaxID=57577 RepID=A0ACB0LB28_TRIPR|nr:unnamed protein product [Trifolium pratense]